MVSEVLYFFILLNRKFKQASTMLGICYTCVALCCSAHGCCAVECSVACCTIQYTAITNLTIGAPHGLQDGLIHPLAKYLSTYLLTSSDLAADILY